MPPKNPTSQPWHADTNTTVDGDTNGYGWVMTRLRSRRGLERFAQHMRSAPGADVSRTLTADTAKVGSRNPQWLRGGAVAAFTEPAVVI